MVFYYIYVLVDVVIKDMHWCEWHKKNQRIYYDTLAYSKVVVTLFCLKFRYLLSEFILHMYHNMQDCSCGECVLPYYCLSECFYCFSHLWSTFEFRVSCHVVV
jgi:hypothetical protein